MRTRDLYRPCPAIRRRQYDIMDKKLELVTQLVVMQESSMHRWLQILVAIHSGLVAALGFLVRDFKHPALKLT